MMHIVQYGPCCNITVTHVLIPTSCVQGGKTPLHYAAEGGHTAVVRLLLERGADKNREDYVGGLACSSATLQRVVVYVHEIYVCVAQCT